MQLPIALLRRNPDSHKGDYGHIFLVGGASRYSGAPVLAAEAAMRTGAGLVTLGIPKSLNNAIIKIKLREVMTLPLKDTKKGNLSLLAYKAINEFIKKIDIVVLGPGLGQEPDSFNLARKIIKFCNKPLIIDADGLNALAGHLNLLRTAHSLQRITILTPHPGEMARLLGVSIEKLQKNRERFAKEFAKKYHLTLVLKGHRSIVVDYSGKIFINRTGNPGMATAGSGDVLTGMIAGLLGQGSSAFEAARIAVNLHGLAGDWAAKENSQISLIASDIIGKIPKVIKRLS